MYHPTRIGASELSPNLSHDPSSPLSLSSQPPQSQLFPSLHPSCLPPHTLNLTSRLAPVLPNTKKITILSYNIEGLAGKINDPSTIRMFLDFDVICLQETHTGSEFQLPGFLSDCYTSYWSNAIKLSNHGRHSGGVLVLVRNSLNGQIRVIEHSNDFTVALKADKDVFGLENDLVIIAVYIPPKDSPYYNHSGYSNGILPLESLIHRLSEISTPEFVICGDLNARTGSSQPFIDMDADPLHPCSESVSDSYIRRSDDTVTNQFGRALIELCACFGFIIVNGTNNNNGDSGYTFISPNGNSVVDYFLVSSGLMDILNPSMTLLDTTHSWHSAIGLTLSIPYAGKIPDNTLHHHRVVWDDRKAKIFTDKLESNDSAVILATAYEHLQLNDVDSAVSCYTTMLMEASKCMTQNISNTPRAAKSLEWFDHECRSLRRTVRQKLRIFRKYKRDSDKSIYLDSRKQYKKLIFAKRQNYNNARIHYIKTNINDSNIFWKEMKKGRTKPKSANGITLTQWYDHFKAVYSGNALSDISSHCDPVTTINDVPNFDLTNDTELDSEITEEEVLRGINNLKNGKSAGPDDVSCEMIKNSLAKSSKFLKSLLNHIFTNCVFPTAWSKSIIVPIFKKGDAESVDNYRGIALTSVISKVYTYILNKRLTKWCDDNLILSEEQAGFRRNYSTTDHVFTLHSIIQRQFSLNRKLYVAFIDFHKAFDLIHRQTLWAVLNRAGLSVESLMFKALTSIYSNVTAAVRTKHGEISEYFECPMGVKQGCNLSPQLFIMFINELAYNVAKNGKFGIQLIPNEVELFLLLFADDVTLISSSPKGLQNQIDRLNEESRRLSLRVNTSKTKIMIFRKGGYISKGEKWQLNGEVIEIVNSYKYLGSEFTTRLSLNNMSFSSTPKAKMAVYEIIRCLKSLQCQSLSIFAKLFTAKVQPILLYGSEIWGAFESVDVERVHTFAFKTFLKLPLHSSNYLLYGEIGRYPLHICSVVNMLRYWIKLLKLPTSRLSKQAYIMQLNMLNNGHSNWASRIKGILESNGFGYIWANQYVANEKYFIARLQERLKDCFIQRWRENLRNKEEFQLYCSIKVSFVPESYLNNLSVSHYRNSLARFRVCSSSIACHKNRFSENSQRACPLCHADSEDELHFLLICHKLEELRTSVLPEHCLLNRHSKTVIDLLKEQKNSFLVGKFIFHATRLRENLLQGQ